MDSPVAGLRATTIGAARYRRRPAAKMGECGAASACRSKRVQPPLRGAMARRGRVWTKVASAEAALAAVAPTPTLPRAAGEGVGSRCF